MVFDPLRFRSIRFPVAVPLLSSFFPLFSNFWFVLRRFRISCRHFSCGSCAFSCVCVADAFALRRSVSPRTPVGAPSPPARRDVQRTHSLESVFWVFTRGGS